MKRLIAFFLAVVLSFSLVATVSATPTEDVQGMTFTATDQVKLDKPVTEYVNTYEAWIRMPADYPTTERGGVILGSYTGDWTKSFTLEVWKNGAIHIQQIVDTDNHTVEEKYFGNVNVCTGQWVHVAVVNDQAQNKLICYVNGQAGHTYNNYSLSDSLSKFPLVVGGDLRGHNEQYFKGEIRSVALYSDARTPEEIQADMQAVEQDDLVAAWDLTEQGADKFITDISGNGYNITNPWFTEKEPVTDFDYSFVVVGDTQIVNYHEPEKLADIYDWIVENKEEKKIQYVLGLGDITDKNTAAEYENALAQFAKLDANGIGYSLVRGNHDKSPEFNAAFKKEPYISSFDGAYNSNLEDTYRTIEVCGNKYLIFTLNIGPSDAVINWASGVIEAHPDHKVIITTHVHQDEDGSLLGEEDFLAAPTFGGSNNSIQMWDKFIKKHENIVLVLSGHVDCDYIPVNQMVGDHGNLVTQMLFDPQGLDLQIGATGMISILHFSEGGNKITVETYSTVRQAYYRQENQFELCLHSYADATCAAPKTCTICGDTQGDALGHNYADATCTAAKTCDRCGDEQGKALGHAYDNLCDAKCNVCGADRVAPHAFIAVRLADDENHWYQCFVCEEKKEVNGHTYDNACDVTCNGCGRVRTVSAHVYDNNCDTTCNVCKAARIVAHDYEKATCTKARTCKVCGDTEGYALGHNYAKATCTTAKTCKDCGAIEGKALGHSYSAATCTTAKTCKVCGVTDGNALGHSYTAATCTAAKTCKVCGDTEGRALGHDMADATCTKAKTCKDCGATDGTALGHSYETTTTKATLTEDGSIVKKCGRCSTVASNTTIKAVKTIKLSATSYTYNGKVKKPTVTIKDSAGKTISSSNYTVKYASGRKNVGTYKVTITFKGNYSGTRTLTFKIVPKAASVNKLTGEKKAVTVKLNKQTTQTSGYQIQYATKKTFTSAKTTNITSNKTTSKTIKSLNAKTTYYVRVRSYKTVNGVKIYSAWSSAKSVKTK